MLNGKSVPTLLHLSPEVRDEIFFHALVASENIHLLHRKGKIAGRVLRTTSTRKHELPGQRLAVGLLRTNKSINATTAPIFYGNNVFLIANSEHFAEWLQLIGRNAHSVRLIKLIYASMCHASFLDTLLSSIPRLAKLEIPCGRLSSPSESARSLKEFVVVKMKKGQDHNATMREVLDILVFYGCRDLKRVSEGLEGVAEAHSREVKMLLANSV